MSTRRNHPSWLAAFGVLVLSGCATESADLREEPADLSNVRCANGEPLTCVEKMGEKIDCTCESLEPLRRILKPGLRNW